MMKRNMKISNGQSTCRQSRAFAHLRNVAVVAAMAFGLSGCNDFLEILPMNDVVLENYWTEKADVESAVGSCYEALCDNDVITRMGIWGESRSDNVVVGGGVPNYLNEILKENVQPSNEMCNWSKFYQIINRCNVVCHYAPKVQAIDPNYSEAEMKANIAEARTIRALAYFYLIRTFRDVPYTTEPSIDDNQNYIIPATSFEKVLDTLIVDLEQVKDDAVRRYSLDRVESGRITFPTDNSSRVTRWAVYALLADLYLWKGDWTNAVKYCDLVLDYKREQLKELQQQGQVTKIELFNNVPLIVEKPSGSSDCGTAYTDLFGNGNSFESLFELYFNGKDGSKNNYVSSFYGNGETTLGYYSIAKFIVDEMKGGKNEVFTNKDCRFYEAYKLSGTSTYAVGKYARSNISFNTDNLSSMTISGSSRPKSTPNANWIIYRLSDVAMIKAEALIEDTINGDLEQAFLLINAVNRRGINVPPSKLSKDTLAMATYTTSKLQMEDLLLAERQREFLFEGKRWYDLVRFARRDGNTSRLSGYVLQKYKQEQNVIKVKMADPNYIYFPYAKNELKVNPLLHQNPAFNKGEDSDLTK